MKKHFILSILILAHSIAGQSQSITNKNYYNFQQSGGSLNWLRASDAVPIIIDELLKNGIAYHTIGVGDLVKLNDTTRFVVTVTFDKGDKEFGFLYEPSHGLPLDAKDREFLNNKAKANYVQAERSINGGAKFMRINPLPDNILLLKQTCYWFQFDGNGTTYPVSKEVAQNILREDIKDYLKKL